MRKSFIQAQILVFFCTGRKGATLEAADEGELGRAEPVVQQKEARRKKNRQKRERSEKKGAGEICPEEAVCDERLLQVVRDLRTRFMYE